MAELWSKLAEGKRSLEGAEEGAAAEDGAHGRKQTKHDSHDSKFKELVETIFQHCNESLSHEMEDAYDVPKYPIQEHQQKLNLIRQMSKRQLPPGVRKLDLHRDRLPGLSLSFPEFQTLEFPD